METRIAGINIPAHKHADVALTSIYGIGRATSILICKKAGVKTYARIGDLSIDEKESLRREVSILTIEGEKRREVAMNIKRKMDIGSYEGRRHRAGLPLRARTKTNAHTRKKGKGRRK